MDVGHQFGPTEIAFCGPPAPKKLVGPRPNIAPAAQTCDNLVMPDGLIDVSDGNAGMHVLGYKG